MKALLKIVARAADAALDNAVEQPQENKKSLGDHLKDAAGNRWVQGGAAAVVVAGAAYGTYRGVKAYRGKKAAGNGKAAAVAEPTADDQIAEARRLITSAETKLARKSAAPSAA